MPLQCISSFIRSAMQHEYAASAWAVMCRMGGILVVDELNGNDGHRLENVMTMEMRLHGLFDSLGLWFEATVGYHFAALYILLTATTSEPAQPIYITFTQSLRSRRSSRQSLSLHRAIFRYQTRVIWHCTQHVPTSHIFLAQASISTPLIET